MEDKDISVEDLEKDTGTQDEAEEIVKDTSPECSEEAKAANEQEGEDLEDMAEEDTAEENQGDESREKRSFFKKDKKEKKDKKDLKIEELNDRLIRTMAEFDNFRKRTEKEKAQMFDIGARDIIEKILPTIDNFERGLGAISEEEKESAFAKGIEKIYKQLVTSLEEAGLNPIEAAGKEFDPNFHNAVMHAEDSELGENMVAEEFQKGYLYKDTVIRHSMVKVVN